jgi:diguanylate cyclase (GGDEF)-like protein/PAS domain S-box-containing protein
MFTKHRHSRILAFAAVALAAGLLLGLAEWPQPERTLEFCGLILAAVLTSAAATYASPARDGATMSPAFVVYFTSLLLFGLDPTMLVVTVGTIAQGLADSRSHALRRTVSNAVTALVATSAAGLAYGALGGTMGQFTWPWSSLPIAAGVVGYCFIEVMAAHVVVPLLARRPVMACWPKDVFDVGSQYVIGAGLAVPLAALIEHRTWEILLVAGVPLYFAGRVYGDYVNRIDHERRRQEVVESLDHGMAVLDSSGQVTFWDDALARIVGCPRERVLGRSLVAAVPALGTTELVRAIGDALTSQSPRTLPRLGLPSNGGARILQVKIVPVAGGVTLLWEDVTERTRAGQVLKRTEERLALAAEGAQDGLWAWDLRNQEFYFSGRWRAMLGLAATAGTGQPQDWIDRVHPDDQARLKAALQEHLSGATELLQHQHRIRCEDGTYRTFLCRGVSVRGAGRGPARIAGSLTEITERPHTPDRLHSTGFPDPLTGLCNRAAFVEGLGRRLDDLKHRRVSGRFAILYLDLDRFKVVNDSVGHLVGDELLVEVSRRLETCLRQGDALARLGGDEFAILLNGLTDEQQANAIAFRIQDVLSAPFSIGGREVFTSASIGIAPGLAHYANPDEIMRDADTAMYHAKSRGKARHELFDADMHARTRDRLGLENDLRHAVHNNDFEVYYQPIVSLASGMCVGFESLVRWTRNGEAVSPVTFIPMAEELGLIEPLGTWVLQQACRTFADWQRRFPEAGLDCITVNVSSRQLMQQNFVYLVEQAVHTSGLKPCNLRVEITETALMDSPHVAAEVLQQLRAFGVKIYLDDFGTGYSSLSHLHKLPVDALKIDRSFVKSLLLPDRPAIVESVLALARTLNTSVVAEGIESDVQARELERLGCTHAQGFLFSRPLSAESAEKLLVANQPLGPKHLPSTAGVVDDPASYFSSKPFEWPQYVPM